MQVLWQESLGYSAEDLTALDVREPLPEQRPRELPAHNGFGSWEDSAQNCTSLVCHQTLHGCMHTHSPHTFWESRCLTAFISIAPLWI